MLNHVMVGTNDIERAKRFREAGLSALGVSIDGLAGAHDKLRGNLGSFAAAMRAVKNAREVGMGIAVSTQINKLSVPGLEELSKRLREEGVETWQIQLTGPLGRAADRPEWLLQPWEIVGVIDRTAGTVAGYKYSQPMIDAGAGGLVWNEASLAEYLKAPKEKVPGNKMAFAGLKKDEDIANVIAWLKADPKP